MDPLICKYAFKDSHNHFILQKQQRKEGWAHECTQWGDNILSTIRLSEGVLKTLSKTFLLCLVDKIIFTHNFRVKPFLGDYSKSFISWKRVTQTISKC